MSSEPFDVASGPQVIFVSGHPGADTWARRRGIVARHLEHLDLADIEHGMSVVGTLPAHLVAEVCARGARYYHLAMDMRRNDRHRQLTADEMEALNARLIRIEARIVDDPTDPMTERSHAE